MKIKNYFLLLILSTSSILFSGEISMEFVFSPVVSHYESLFEKFGRASCGVCSGRQAVHKGLNSACFVKNMQSYHDLFEQELLKHAQEDSDRLFIQAVFLDEVVGFMSCQIISDVRVIIHQLVIDPEKYDENLIKDFLFAILQLMPKVKEISMICPLFSVDFIDLFADLGFVPVDQELNSDLFVQFELKVHPKCAMCKILYGDDFWEDEDPDAWEHDPDQEDLPVGFYNVDERFDNNPLPEDNDGKSSY